jgi:hypothetical protein
MGRSYAQHRNKVYYFHEALWTFKNRGFQGQKLVENEK